MAVLCSESSVIKEFSKDSLSSRKITFSSLKMDRLLRESLETQSRWFGRAVIDLLFARGRERERARERTAIYN